MALGRTLISAVLTSAALLGSITGLRVTPSTITFTSPDPDITPVGGSATATVAWGMSGNNNGDWRLTVQSAAPSLSLCPTVPASAIVITCAGLSISGKGNPTGSCASGAFPLSTGPQIVASGARQGKSDITAVVSFAFTDNWKYLPSSACSIDLIYTITAAD
jgi:hypothetical protein